MTVSRVKIKLNRKKTVLTKAGHKKLVGRKFASAPKFRSSLKVGTILILLAGKHKGKRCVLVKLLENSGLLLITGPFLVNGVPLRRVNPRYVIATSTNIFDLDPNQSNQALQSLESVLSQFNEDDFHKKQSVRINEIRKKKRSKDSDDMFVDEVDDNKVFTSEEHKQRQDLVDGVVTPLLSKVPLLPQYLKTRFTLKNGMYPHLLKF